MLTWKASNSRSRGGGPRRTLAENAVSAPSQPRRQSAPVHHLSRIEIRESALQTRGEHGGLPAQRKKVAADHIASDLRHDQAERLFTAGTIQWFNDLPNASRNSNATLTKAVEEGRQNIQYEQLRNTTLKNAEGLRSWLGKEALEHMYVHADNKIYTGGRDREKLPHPTLVGGDPDATCAGTMAFDVGAKTVTITNESGHFRPPKVPSSTVKLVQDVFPKGKGYKAEKKEVG